MKYRFGLVVAALVLVVSFPEAVHAQRVRDTRIWDELALWADLIYTIRSTEKAEWTITPSIRTDEQELNAGFMTRVATDATVALQKGWDFRGAFVLVGRETAAKKVVLDERVQLLFRRTLVRFWDDKIRLRGGVFYERHFRGDDVPDFNVYRTRLELRGDGIRKEPWGQQDFFFDHARGFFRSRTRVGMLWNFRNHRQVRLGYQFQYTQGRGGDWAPQHAIVFRYWFGSTLSWRGVN